MSFPCQSVAVIGAGISGVVAAAHLKREGIEVTVFERSSAPGGVWYVFQHFYISSRSNVMKGFTTSESRWNRHIRDRNFREPTASMQTRN
jgi:cation diffusion facilitator CzcD-associated flavoprotein CzcO